MRAKILKQQKHKKELSTTSFKTNDFTFIAYKLPYQGYEIDNDYGINFNIAYLGTYDNIYELALKIVTSEEPDSEFENNLINYIDNCESLFDLNDELRFDNLENLIKLNNLDLIIGVIESALDCEIVKKLGGVRR
jgi:hypothetical protein